MKIPKYIKEEIEHLQNTNIPRCLTCKKNYIQESPYVWKPNCEHSKNVRIALG